ncbi:hypothetical protein IGI04_005581 [Brassica rapa subsp. trilocularis]|uniref:Uncharacterized protein n=1 Tax=Brassica rapa subsp. trilocularis TaxID=1813537 RepID=A0ABQ7NEE9_BRACM|nr:hypothetical protein IGI04_005581 [Brassica rapa subsp. trilocularis]
MAFTTKFGFVGFVWNDKEKVDGSAAGLYLRGTFDDGRRFHSSINQLHFPPFSPCRSTELADRRMTHVRYRYLRNSNWWLNEELCVVKKRVVCCEEESCGK